MSKELELKLEDVIGILENEYGAEIEKDENYHYFRVKIWDKKMGCFEELELDWSEMYDLLSYCELNC